MLTSSAVQHVKFHNGNDINKKSKMFTIWIPCYMIKHYEHQPSTKQMSVSPCKLVEVESEAGTLTYQDDSFNNHVLLIITIILPIEKKAMSHNSM